MQLRNNLLLGARTAMYSLYIPSGARGDLDYDGYNRQQSNLVKYNSGAYANLPAFYTGAGQEHHGIEVAFSDFVRAPSPSHPEWDFTTGYGTAALPTDIDLTLTASSVAIDRGVPLPNIDDGFAGAAPDLGCYERGAALPWYGPRPTATLDTTGPTLPSPQSAALRLSPPSPNPSLRSVSLALEAGLPSVASIKIVDTAGRSVRTISDSSQVPTGTQRIVWDGRDDAGNAAPTGMYFVVVRSGVQTLTQRVVLLQ